MLLIMYMPSLMVKDWSNIRLSPLHYDIYCTHGAQCQVMRWIWFDVLTGNQGKGDALGNGGEQQVALHHSEVVADAMRGPASKGM